MTRAGWSMLKMGADIAQLALFGRKQGVEKGLEVAAKLVESKDPALASEIRALDVDEILRSMHQRER